MANPSSQRVIQWYRTPLERETIKELHERSDALGALQTLGYLAVITLTGATVCYAAGHWPWWVTGLLLWVHGTVFAFQINAVHELGHNTVFKTQFLNEFFLRIFAFLGWINCDAFGVSHTRHHRYTLHPPDDQEVVLPQKFPLKFFLTRGFIDIPGFVQMIQEKYKRAAGIYDSAWNQVIFPPDKPALRRPVKRWTWCLILGHLAIIAVSIYFQLWMLPVVTTFAAFYGGLLFLLTNVTQHAGLKDNVPDFRLCCRTIRLNPFLRFLYWHMNFHTEHHMYAAVPCYKLGRLHRLIQHELPPTLHGLVATWKQIAAIQRRQKTEPEYQYAATLPASSLERATVKPAGQLLSL
jgi:fatty acid desaturase